MSLVASEDSGGFGDVKNPLDSVTAGLMDSAGQMLPLQAVHVKCKLVDLLSQVRYMVQICIFYFNRHDQIIINISRQVFFLLCPSDTVTVITELDCFVIPS